ncbi:cytochrome c oxidase subunit 3 [Nitrosomonas cryotolerans]|nr:cytochrome c oxidase subunit 3 [Nitrosomonas cryotolerans]
MNKAIHFEQRPLPVGSDGKLSMGWWGILALIVTEGSLFGFLLFAYFYLSAQTEQQWPPEGLPNLLMPTINTAILLASSVSVWVSEYGIRHQKKYWSIGGMLMAVALGFCFLKIQLIEWSEKSFDITSNLYGSLYFTITGFHLFHVIIGLAILFLLLVWISLNYFNDKRYAAVTIGGAYWHFVDVVWLFVFASLYLFPYL